jgi:hypothetical protein
MERDDTGAVPDGGLKAWRTLAECGPFVLHVNGRPRVVARRPRHYEDDRLPLEEAPVEIDDEIGDGFTGNWQDTL